MGIRLFGNSCCNCSIPPPYKSKRNSKTIIIDNDLNPDPKNFNIIKHTKIGRFLIVKINYPNCTNYEGDKILVYEDISIEILRQKEELDPHFCDNDKCLSPLARFEPTEKGWKCAEIFVNCKH